MYFISDEEYDGGVDFCTIYNPCKSQARCINDRLHQYICICMVETDLSRNCTDGGFIGMVIPITLLTHTVPLPIILVKWTMVKSTGTNNIGRD